MPFGAPNRTDMSVDGLIPTPRIALNQSSKPQFFLPLSGSLPQAPIEAVVLHDEDEIGALNLFRINLSSPKSSPRVCAIVSQLTSRELMNHLFLFHHHPVQIHPQEPILAPQPNNRCFQPPSHFVHNSNKNPSNRWPPQATSP